MAMFFVVIYEIIIHVYQTKKDPDPCFLKVTVTVFSSGCLQIRFGVLIIDYICNFLIWPPWLYLFQFKRFEGAQKGTKLLKKGAILLKKRCYFAQKSAILLKNVP